MFRPKNLTFPSVFQRGIARRAVQDARWPRENWGEDRTENDPEDFYPEAHLPKPPVARRGKVPFISLETDSSDDDCQELVPLDAVPLNALCPDPDAPPASGKRKARAKATTTEAQAKAPATEAPSVSRRGRGKGRSGTRGQKRTSAARELSETSEPSGRATKRKRVVHRQFQRAVYDG